MTILLPTTKLLPPAITTLAVASAFVPDTVTAVVAFGTFTVYAKVPGAKLSTLAPLTFKSLKLALVDLAARFTDISYVFLVKPSSAVTSTVILLTPMLIRLNSPLACPLITVLPFTFTVA
ncbi:hypothetical protein D3C73_585610 [compost metagenome]